VVEPADAVGARHPIPDEATIGRAGGCTITVDDTFASSLHARLFRTPDGVFVEDLGSTNGTVLNGERIGGPRPLFGGDRVKVGNTVLEAR
jgi:pSer/pThr/pTyr-binding forkhead associated (FHA) protein